LGLVGMFVALNPSCKRLLPSPTRVEITRAVETLFVVLLQIALGCRKGYIYWLPSTPSACSSLLSHNCVFELDASRA